MPGGVRKLFYAVGHLALCWLDPIQTAPLRRLQACAQASNTLVFLFRPSNVACLFSPCPLRLGLSPGAQGPLHLVCGPYRIETGWWQDRWALRDYFVAADRSARRDWIYRERDHMHASWFLHGFFG